MNWLMESPLSLLALGACAVAALAAMYHQTRNARLLWAVGAALLATAGAVMLERLVVTDSEQVEQTLTRAARALRAGDVAAVQAHIGDAAMRKRVEQYMQLYDFHEAGYGGLKLRFNQLTSPPTATAEFLARVSVNYKGGGQAGSVVQPMIVRLEKRDDQWVLMGYQFTRFREPLAEDRAFGDVVP